jgi:hypothetical protein
VVVNRLLALSGVTRKGGVDYALVFAFIFVNKAKVVALYGQLLTKLIINRFEYFHQNR